MYISVLFPPDNCLLLKMKFNSFIYSYCIKFNYNHNNSNNYFVG